MGRTACTKPQCLYRVSVPVQSLSACTEPQCLYRVSVPVQSLSACTEPQCLYTASVLVQNLSSCTEAQCLYRASVPVQSLSACTEPQCLYRASVPVQGFTLRFYNVSYQVVLVRIYWPFWADIKPFQLVISNSDSNWTSPSFWVAVIQIAVLPDTLSADCGSPTFNPLRLHSLCNQ